MCIFFKKNSIFFQFFVVEKLAAVGLKKKKSESLEAATWNVVVGGYCSASFEMFFNIGARR